MSPVSTPSAGSQSLGRCAYLSRTLHILVAVWLLLL